MSDLLNIGASGLRSYRAALNVVGDNVANANTVGYARRSIIIAESAITNGANPLYRNAFHFGGSEPVSVERASDLFAVAEARTTSADASRASAVANWLATAERALGGAIAPALTGVFTAVDRLAADPVSSAPRLAFLASVDSAAATIRDTGEALARAAEGIAVARNDGVARVNTALDALASVNRAIARQQSGTAAFQSLADQRDLLIDGITAATGAASIIATDGSATVRLASVVLIDRTTQATLGAGSGGYALDGASVAITKGGLAGLAEAQLTLTDRIDEADALARSFADTINGWQTAGRRPDGSAGTALLAGVTATTLVGTVATVDAVAVADANSPNGNALALNAARSATGLEAAATALVKRQAIATATAREASERADERRDAAATERDAVEGVDLDREAADLLRYQQAYQGSARIVQVARELVDTILAIFR